MPGTKRRRLVGATLEPEEPFARQWRPGRDADGEQSVLCKYEHPAQADPLSAYCAVHGTIRFFELG